MLQEIQNDFTKGKTSKQEYIQQMYTAHENLFDYVSFLKNTPVKKIEILPTGGVLFELGEDGIKIFCDRNDKRTAPFEMMNFGEYEGEDGFMIYSLIQENFNVVDIGANIGWYSINIAKKIRKGTIYSFEAIPETYARLQKNISLNNIQNIKLFNIALSDKVGEATFYISPTTSVSGSAANITQDTAAKEVRCKMEMLDVVLKEEESSIDFIKCDVEGAELFVLKGGLTLLKKSQPILFCEMLRKWSAAFHYHPNDIIHLMKELGYACYFVKNKNLVQISEINDQTQETNFFFLHTQKHQSIIQQYVS